MINVYMAMADKLSKEPGRLHEPNVMFWVLVSCIGFILWLYTYVLAFRFGRRNKSYAIPSLAICLNFGWEYLTRPAVWPD